MGIARQWFGFGFGILVIADVADCWIEEKGSTVAKFDSFAGVTLAAIAIVFFDGNKIKVADQAKNIYSEQEVNENKNSTKY